MQKHKTILITGGIRSGKSRYALTLARKIEGKKVFLATAEAFDEHMTQRINRHQKDREGAFQTVEEPFNLGEKIDELKPLADVIVVDCLTVWINNLLYQRDNHAMDIKEPQDRLILALQHCKATVIMVTNEVGAGGLFRTIRWPANLATGWETSIRRWPRSAIK